MGRILSVAPLAFSGLSSRRSRAIGPVAYALARLASDPLYTMTITLNNIVAGSRYRITRHDTGAELAIGLASGSTEVVTGIPVFTSSQLMDITIRNASGSPAYKIFDTAAYAAPSGTEVFVSQQLDE